MPQIVVSRTTRSKAGRKRAPTARPASCSAAAAKPSRKIAADDEEMHEDGVRREDHLAELRALRA